MDGDINDAIVYSAIRDLIPRFSLAQIRDKVALLAKATSVGSLLSSIFSDGRRINRSLPTTIERNG
jgi:hypothetical protein